MQIREEVRQRSSGLEGHKGPNSYYTRYEEQNNQETFPQYHHTPNVSIQQNQTKISEMANIKLQVST